MSFYPSGKVLYDELPEVLNYTVSMKYDGVVFRKGTEIITEKMGDLFLIAFGTPQGK